MRALLTLSTISLAWLLHRSLKRVSAAIDESFCGDCWNVPPEALSRSAETVGGGGSEAKADRLVTQHNSGTRTVAAREGL